MRRKIEVLADDPALRSLLGITFLRSLTAWIGSACSPARGLPSDFAEDCEVRTALLPGGSRTATGATPTASKPVAPSPGGRTPWPGATTGS